LISSRTSTAADDISISFSGETFLGGDTTLMGNINRVTGATWAHLEAAYRRVEGGCECGEDTSCYGCLRSYRNQYAHTQLRRGPVKRYLRDMLRLLEASG
jgi:hypothetical protein